MSVATKGAKAPPSTTWEVIDPATAAIYLGKCVSNRNLRRGTVTAYASDMKANRWLETGGTISFNEKGELDDGQHRLHAIIESGTTQRILVVRGVSAAAREVIDAGAARSAADALKLSNRVPTNHPAVAAAARLAILWGEGHHRNVRAGVNGARKVTNSEITSWVDDQLAAEATSPGILIITGAVGQARGWHGVNNSVSLSVSSFLYLLLGSVDVLDADEFFRKFDELDFTGFDDPVQQLYLRFNEAQRRKEELRISQKLWYIITAWNAFRAGGPLKTNFVTKTGGGYLVSKVPKETVKGGIKSYPQVPNPA